MYMHCTVLKDFKTVVSYLLNTEVSTFLTISLINSLMMNKTIFETSEMFFFTNSALFNCYVL